MGGFRQLKLPKGYRNLGNTGRMRVVYAQDKTRSPTLTYITIDSSLPCFPLNHLL